MWFKDILRPKARNNAKRPAGAQKRAAQSNTLQIDELFLRRLERLALEVRRNLSGNPNSGEHPSRQQLPASIFSDHRPYSHGDDYRNVDWNAYARHEQVVVKLGEAEQDINVHVLLDRSRSMDWGTPAKMLVAQQLAAAIGYVALAHSDRVRMTPFGTSAATTFGPAQGKGRVLEMLRFISDIVPADRTEFSRTLNTYARQYERGGLVVICSDLLAAPTDDLEAALRTFAPPRWQVLVLHILDRRELEPTLGGEVELVDAETGENIPVTLDVDTIAQYKRNMLAWQEQIASTCAHRGATYAQVLTDWPLEKAMIPYLRLRRILA